MTWVLFTLGLVVLMLAVGRLVWKVIEDEVEDHRDGR
jgi:cytochrome b561